MTSAPVQLAPDRRDDLRGDVAERAGVSTREALRVLADVCHVAEAFLANDLLVRQMPIVARHHRRDLAAARHARAIIALVSPAICPACGTINVLWFEPGGAARYPCVGPGCNHRVIKIAGHGSPSGLADEGGGAVPSAPADPLNARKPDGLAGPGYTAASRSEEGRADGPWTAARSRQQQEGRFGAHGSDAGGNPTEQGAPAERVEGPHPIDPVGAAGAGLPGAATANATDGAAPAAACTAGAAENCGAS